MTDEDKNTESYQLNELDKKDEELGEDAPLKPNEATVETTTTTTTTTGTGGDICETKENEKAIMASIDGEKGGEKDENTTNKLLNYPKAKLIVAIAGAVLLVLLLLIVAIVVILTSDGVRELKIHEWEEDKTWRYIRIIPKPNGPKNLITFRHGNLPFEGKVWPDLVEQLRELVANYDPLLSRNATTCGPTTTPPPNTVCLFNIRNIDPDCLKDNFGYDAGTPCIFIQFNNISDWVPEPYTANDYDENAELPKGMIVTQRIPSVYLECSGNTPVDQESMGQVDYTPMQGFPSQYFPYTRQPNYMPPLVAIKFKSPKTSIAIGITCKLWAKNLDYTDDSEPVPILPFNLFIE